MLDRKGRQLLDLELDEASLVFLLQIVGQVDATGEEDVARSEDDIGVDPLAVREIWRLADHEFLQIYKLTASLKPGLSLISRKTNGYIGAALLPDALGRLRVSRVPMSV